MKIKHLVAPLLAIFLYFYLSLFSNALIDDSFITLRYVKTLLSSGTWGFIPGYTANAVSSPLNIILLTFAGFFLGPTVNAVIYLAAITLTFITILLTRMSRQLFETEIFGYLAAGALIFNPFVISTLGLESMIFAGLYILSAYFYINSRWALLAVMLALITVTRFDGFLFFLVTFPLIPAFAKLRFKFTTIYTLCITPWYVFSWLYLGSLFPDTLFIKLSGRIQGMSFLNGIAWYLQEYLLETILSFLLLPFVLLFFNKQVRTSPFIHFLVLTSLVHLIGYSLLGVFPYHWYYTTEITAVILISFFGLGTLDKNNGLKVMQRIKIQGIATTFLAVQVLGMFYILARDGFAIKEMPIHTNWATHEQYKEIGEWLKMNNKESAIMIAPYNGEVGTLGYYCDCYLESSFSDGSWMQQYVNNMSAGKGIGSLLHRINFLFFGKTEELPQPTYVLLETPNGELTEKKGDIMKWETATKWLSRCSIRLSNFSTLK